MLLYIYIRGSNSFIWEPDVIHTSNNNSYTFKPQEGHSLLYSRKGWKMNEALAVEDYYRWIQHIKVEKGKWCVYVKILRMNFVVLVR